MQILYDITMSSANGRLTNWLLADIFVRLPFDRAKPDSEMQRSGIELSLRTMENTLMIVENATTADIDLLTELRLAYLKEDLGKLNDDDIVEIRRNLPNYFKRNLNQNIFCYLIREEEKIAACAFLLVIEKPMSPAFITGKTGTILNVYTDPLYRHKGYAKKVMNRILSDAVAKKLSVIELKSTDAGHHLYQSVGFTDEISHYHCMKWYNQQVLNHDLT